MKKLYLLFILIFLVMYSNAAFSMNNQVIVGVSPFLQYSEVPEIKQSILKLILKEAKNGDTVDLYDAYNQKLITSLVIPSKAGYKNPKVRVKLFRRDIAIINKFFETQSPLNNTNLKDAIKFPQFLEFISTSLLSKENRPTIVLIIGSPLYVDLKDPFFSMHNGFFPSDGHLLVDQRKSVFGVTHKKGLLDGVRINFVYLNDPWLNNSHKFWVKRFWNLFIGKQGGVLASFSTDLSTTLGSLYKNIRRIKPDVIDNKDETVQMYLIKRDMEKEELWIRRNSIKTHPNTTLQTKGTLKIGIKWNSFDCDLDLYTKPFDTAKELFYKQAKTAEGTYYKDFRRFSNPLNGHEYVEYNVPVDILNVKAAVNFFSGSSSGGIEGEVQIIFNGKVYNDSFKIKSNHGNKGENSEDRADSDYWIVLDIPSIVGLNNRVVSNISAPSTTNAHTLDTSSTTSHIKYDTPNSISDRKIQIFTPDDGEKIYTSSTEGIPQRLIKGEVYGFTQDEIKQFGLIVEVSIYTIQSYPQGIGEVDTDGTWSVLGHFGGYEHTIKAVLKDKHGSELAETASTAILIRR
ncbi:MAG: hypothetical protein GY928_32470 [Colwellia sp.]|nr:hypothetical protein [Colwellia sp.]